MYVCAENEESLDLNFHKTVFSYFFLMFRVVTLHAVARRCSLKKVFLKFLQNSQENTCARVSF